MLENKQYSHSGGKQQIRLPNVKPGNMYAFIYAGGKKRRKIVKRGK